MANSSLSPNIPELVGRRLLHTAPGYGSGRIAQAYLTENAEIYVKISFDNNREANPFSLIKCINKGLIVLSDSGFDIDMLTQIASAKEQQLQEASREEEERRKEEAYRREAERKRREEERLNSILREREAQRREAEKREAERLAAEQAVHKRQLEEKKRIFDFLTTDRNVQFLVHFTPVSNLPSILARGIMPRSSLAKEGIQADTPDEQRLDFRMDYSSFSISFPNYRVFYSKQKNTPFTYSVLIIDPQIILDLPLGSISYLPDNAASGTLRRVEDYTGLESVKALFSEKVIIGKTEYSREQMELPDHFTTNPQAPAYASSR